MAAVANSAAPTIEMTAPTSMNGLRTRTLSDTTPATTSAMALVIQYQFSSELARASE